MSTEHVGWIGVVEVDVTYIGVRLPSIFSQGRGVWKQAFALYIVGTRLVLFGAPTRWILMMPYRFHLTSCYYDVCIDEHTWGKQWAEHKGMREHNGAAFI